MLSAAAPRKPKPRPDAETLRPCAVAESGHPGHTRGLECALPPALRSAPQLRTPPNPAIVQGRARAASGHPNRLAA